jgi:hypothetical protein
VRKLAILTATLTIAATAPWATLFAVDVALGEPPRAYHRHRCTRYCHDRGCPHRPVLPAALTSSEGLFGKTVLALHVMGRATGLGPSVGYGVVNIVIFCLLWPGAMLWLVGVVTWQRLQIAELRRGGR